MNCFIFQHCVANRINTVTNEKSNHKYNNVHKANSMDQMTYNYMIQVKKSL